MTDAMTPINPTFSTFNYKLVSNDVAAIARSARDRIVSNHRAAIIDSGQLLIQAKKALGHGHFVSWCEAELGFSPTTARNYMRAAEAFGTKTATVAALPPGALYAAAGAPKEVRDEIERRAAAGETLKRDDVVALISAKRADRRRRKEAEIRQIRRSGMSADQAKKVERRLQREQREADARIKARRDAASEAIDRLLVHTSLSDLEEIAALIEKASHHFFNVIAERKEARRY